KMPGDEWQRFANMRCLFAYMYTHPGTKLMFMGSEFGQEHEWAHDKSLDWHLAENAPHKGLENFMRDLNHICKTEPALYEHNFSPKGFEWIKVNDAEQSVIIYMRKGIHPNDVI